jgi:hypothetical protein
MMWVSLYVTLCILFLNILNVLSMFGYKFVRGKSGPGDSGNKARAKKIA